MACRSATTACCQTAARPLVSRAGASATGRARCPRAAVARNPDPDGGHFAIRPAGEFEANRGYLAQTTTFRTAAGTAVLTDAMAVGRNERDTTSVRISRVLLRQLACTDGGDAHRGVDARVPNTA